MPYQSFVDANFSPAELWSKIQYEIRFYGAPLVRLRNALLYWARRWHLEADWCFDAVCWTLHQWRQLPHYISEYQWWSVGSSSWMRLNNEAFSHLTVPHELPKWEADSQFRTQYVQYAERQIKDHVAKDPFICALKPKLKRAIIDAKMSEINNYCDGVLRVYDSQVDDSGEPTWKRAESKDELIRNVKWAVSFQVLNQTYSDIASRENVAVSTVSRSVKYVLTLIGLPIRPDSGPGFPRGKKHSRRGSAKLLKNLGR